MEHPFRGRAAVIAAGVTPLLAGPAGQMLDSFGLMMLGLSLPVFWLGLPGPLLPYLSLARYRAYAALFMAGSFADYYVRFWQRCWERPLPHLQVSAWLLAVGEATDRWQGPIATLRKFCLSEAYDFPPLLLLQPLVLILFPVISAGFYAWLITAAERTVLRLRRGGNGRR